MGLLESDITKRLGCGDDNMAKLKSHSWFRSINFDQLEAKQIDAPFIPSPKDLKSHKYFDTQCINSILTESVAIEQFELFPKWSQDCNINLEDDHMDNSIDNIEGYDNLYDSNRSDSYD